VVGRHDGIDAFTVGQRRGVGVALGERQYVVDIDASTATVTLGTRDALLRDEVALRDATWVDGAPARERTIAVQWRAHGDAVDANVVDGVVQFARPQPRVAPGQAVVVYDGDVVLGGGIAA
jgi:tRNA-specific 2-thiouridylase